MTSWTAAATKENVSEINVSKVLHEMNQLVQEGRVDPGRNVEKLDYRDQTHINNLFNMTMYKQDFELNSKIADVPMDLAEVKSRLSLFKEKTSQFLANNRDVPRLETLMKGLTQIVSKAQSSSLDV